MDLLQKLNLTDRLVSGDNNLNTVFSKDIDFKTVDIIRDREKAAALEYLRGTMGE